MKQCFIFPKIPTALIFIALLILFLSFWIYLVNFWHSSISLFVIFFILSGVFSAFHLILKQLVSCGESRPGPPNPPFHSGLGSLGLSVTKKGTLTASNLQLYTKNPKHSATQNIHHSYCLTHFTIPKLPMANYYTHTTKKLHKWWSIAENKMRGGEQEKVTIICTEREGGVVFYFREKFGKGLTLAWWVVFSFWFQREPQRRVRNDVW